jgi:hypothetical protein
VTWGGRRGQGCVGRGPGCSARSAADEGHLCHRQSWFNRVARAPFARRAGGSPTTRSGEAAPIKGVQGARDVRPPRLTPGPAAAGDHRHLPAGSGVARPGRPQAAEVAARGHPADVVLEWDRHRNRAAAGVVTVMRV